MEERNGGGAPGSRLFWFLASAILVTAVLVQCWGLLGLIHGKHIFRQTHVAANIEKLLAGGAWLVPETYNHDLTTALFDFPVYQWCVAALCRLGGWPVVPVARLVSIAAFAGSFLALERLLVACGVDRLRTLLALFLFAFAPLSLFYGRSVIPDPLALFLSFLSLGAYAGWDREKSPRRRGTCFALMSAAGLLCVLIKSPILLPTAVAIVSHRLATRGWRSLFEPGLLLFGAAVVAALVWFRIFSAAVNRAPLVSDWERYWYFSNLADRLNFRNYRLVGAVMVSQILNPVTAIAALAGLVSVVRSHREPYRWLFLGWLGGGLLSVGILFNLHWRHDYYQLPLVAPLAFFAACGLASLLRWSSRSPVWRRSAPAVVTLTAAASLALGVREYRRMMKPPPRDWVAAGAWLRRETAADDFVVYLVRYYNPSPGYLYFAGRDGVNLGIDQLSAERLDQAARQYAGRYRRLFVFCPAALASASPVRSGLLGGPTATAPGIGSLYSLPEITP